jgi:hypothetical protein
MQLEMALSQLNVSCACQELQFWGKISGLKNDYFIAVGLNYDEYEFPSKIFF